MPLFKEIPTEVTSAYFALDFGAVRSPGAHCKHIINDYIKTHGLGRAKDNPDFAASLDLFALLGFAWERVGQLIQEDSPELQSVLSGLGLPSAGDAASVLVWEEAFSWSMNRAHRERNPDVFQPGEIIVDGIACTPDGANKRLRCGEEYKATWVSSNASLEEARPDWLMQLPAYAYAYGWDEYLLHVFYVNGGYEYTRMGKPVMKSFRFRWSDEEKEENWREIQLHRRVMEREGRL